MFILDIMKYINPVGVSHAHPYRPFILPSLNQGLFQNNSDKTM